MKQLLALLRPMDFSRKFDKVISGWSIVYFQGSKIVIKNVFLSLKIDIVLANSADPHELAAHVAPSSFLVRTEKCGEPYGGHLWNSPIKYHCVCLWFSCVVTVGDLSWQGSSSRLSLPCLNSAAHFSPCFSIGSKVHLARFEPAILRN